MPVGPADIGIQSSAVALLLSIEYEIALSEKVRTAVNGGLAKAKGFDPLISGSLTVLGSSAQALGVAASGIDGIEDGVTVFTEINHDQAPDNYDETKMSFENAPEAEDGEGEG